MEAEQKPLLGFIGLGAMGGPMARNLLAAGYEVLGFDLDDKKITACVGVRAAVSVADVVARADVVMTSLPSSEAYVQLADEALVPNAREGQIFVEFGTTTPPQLRRLATAFAERGAELLDAPVSGGSGGAERGMLYIFVGGDEATVERCRPLLQIVGDPDKTTYCGPCGAGQVVKGVNQLMMGLGNAAYLEAVAFGVRGGVEADVIQRALGNEGRWRHDLHTIARAAAEGQAEEQSVKFRELPYFLSEAQDACFALPLTQVLYAFCDKGERVARDDKRDAPSYWHELMRASGETD